MGGAPSICGRMVGSHMVLFTLLAADLRGGDFAGEPGKGPQRLWLPWGKEPMEQKRRVKKAGDWKQQGTPADQALGMWKAAMGGKLGARIRSCAQCCGQPVLWESMWQQQVHGLGWGEVGGSWGRETRAGTSSIRARPSRM